MIIKNKEEQVKPALPLNKTPIQIQKTII